MSRYTDVDALLKALPNEPYKGTLRRILMQAPTADVVEVVRCKDCEYWLKWHDRWALEKDTIPEGLLESVEDWGECQCDRCWNQETEADFYCKYGERRDDGEKL